MVTNFIKLRGVRNTNHSSGNTLLIKPYNTALLILDLQDKLINGIPNKENIVWNIKRLIDAARILKMNIYITEQNPARLGKTINLFGDGEQYGTYEKMDFSCFNCKSLMKEIKNNRIENILISGVETHICLLQSALEYIYSGRNVLLPIDSTGSRHNIDYETAIRRMEFSGVTITTTEAAIFELCASAAAKEFKSISAIIKREKDYSSMIESSSNKNNL